MSLSSGPRNPFSRVLAWLETSWGFTLVVGLIAISAAGLRFIRIMVPPERVFDEVYSPLFMWKFLQGETFFDVHPILAELPHAVGLLLFADTPLGWRFSSWVWGLFFTVGIGLCGSLLTGRRLVGVLAALVSALDISFFVYGRTGLPDMFLLAAFVWALACFFLSCRARTVGGRYLSALGSGVLLGSLAATTWFGVGALALVWAWIALARRAGNRWQTRGNTEEGLPPAADCLLPKVRPWLYPVMFIVVPVMTYLLWLIPVVGVPGYVRSAVGEDLFQGSCTFGRVPDPSQQPPTTWLGRARHWHCTVWNYHAYLNAQHPYASPWWSWPLLTHPVLFYLDSNTDPPRQISATGNPVLWWTGFAAIFLTLFSLPLRWMRRRRDKETGAQAGTLVFSPWQDLLVELWLLLGIFGFWLPWAFIQRVTFHYHYFLSFTLTVILLALCLARFLDRRSLRPLALSFLLAALGGFIYLYPTATAALVFWAR